MAFTGRSYNMHGKYKMLYKRNDERADKRVDWSDGNKKLIHKSQFVVLELGNHGYFIKEIIWQLFLLDIKEAYNII